MSFYTKKVLLIILTGLLLTGVVKAQDDSSSVLDFDFGAEVVSRYIWRGVESGGDPAVPQLQPYASFSVDGGEYGLLELGAWGSYGFSGDFSENDLSLKYTYSTSPVNISLTLNDYYFPYLGINFTNFEDKGEGAHTIEAGLALTGNESFPFTFLVSKNIKNDVPEDKSLYVEAGYAFSINEVEMNVFAGAAQGMSLWHGISTDKFEVCTVGIGAGKEIRISESYSLPLGINWIMNPHQKKTFLVFKVGLFKADRN